MMEERIGQNGAIGKNGKPCQKGFELLQELQHIQFRFLQTNLRQEMSGNRGN
jgi:hypothetical protein